MFCKQCNTLVCHTCIANTHMGHTFVKPEDIYAEKKIELQNYMSSSENSLASYEKILKDCDLKKIEVSKEAKRHSERVSERHKKRITFLDKAMEKMKFQLQQDEFDDHRRLDDITKKVKKAMSSVRDFNQACTKKLSAPPTEMLSFLPAAKSIHGQHKLYNCPPVSGAAFKPYDNTAVEVERLLGSIVKGKKHNLTDFETNVVSSFKTETSVNRMVCTKDENLWIGAYKDKEIALINSKGELIKSVNIGYPLYDFTLSIQGELLITCFHNYNVKKLSGNKGTMIDIYDASPFYTYGISATPSGGILLGLYDFKGKRESKIIRLSPTGQILQTLIGKTIFKCPGSITESWNNDIYVISLLDQEVRELICMNCFGNFKFRCTRREVGNLRDDEEFRPIKVIFDSNGNEFLIDADSAIQLHDDNGKFIQHLLHHKDAGYKPTIAAIDRYDNLWVSDFEAKTIYKIKYLDP